VALVRTDVSEEPGASSIRVTKLGELGTIQAATSNRRTLRRNFFAAYVGCIIERGIYSKIYQVTEIKKVGGHVERMED
jgi:hypothetical protein